MYTNDYDNIGCDGLGCMNCEGNCDSGMSGLGYVRRGGRKKGKTRGRMTRAAYIKMKQKQADIATLKKATQIKAKTDANLTIILSKDYISQGEWNKLPANLRVDYTYTTKTFRGKSFGRWTKKSVLAAQAKVRLERKQRELQISARRRKTILLSKPSTRKPSPFRSGRVRLSKRKLTSSWKRRRTPRGGVQWAKKRRIAMQLRQKAAARRMQAAADRRITVFPQQKAVQAQVQNAKVAQAETKAIVTKRNYKAIQRNAEVDPTITNLEMASDAKKDANRAKANLRQVKIIGPEGILPTPVQRKTTNPMTPMTSVEEYDREPVTPVEEAGIGILPVIAGAGALLFFLLRRKRRTVYVPAQ